VYLTCGPHSIVARMESPERPLVVGQTLEVELKMLKTHLFDRRHRGPSSKVLVTFKSVYMVLHKRDLLRRATHWARLGHF